MHAGSFPRIFCLPVHAYLVYNRGLSTHIWSTFTHKWSIKLLHLHESEADMLHPVCLYEYPIWIACSSSVLCGNGLAEGRREPPPPHGEKAPAALIARFWEYAAQREEAARRRLRSQGAERNRPGKHAQGRPEPLRGTSRGLAVCRHTRSQNSGALCFKGIRWAAVDRWILL